MSDQLIREFEQEYKEKKASYPDFKSGDTINVAVKIKEGNKERIQNFQGTVIQRRNEGSNGETFTVRKISNGIVSAESAVFRPVGLCGANEPGARLVSGD